MNAPDPKLAKKPIESRPRTEREEDLQLQGGWFSPVPSQIVPAAPRKSVSPTGDDEVDTWLR